MYKASTRFAYENKHPTKQKTKTKKDLLLFTNYAFVPKWDTRNARRGTGGGRAHETKAQRGVIEMIVTGTL